MRVSNMKQGMPFDHLRTFTSLFSKDEELVILDVGANDGSSSLQYLKTFPKSHIVAFEPGTQAFRKLETNVRDFNQVKVEKLALSDTIGTKILNVTEMNEHKDSSLYKVSKSSKSIQMNLHPKSEFVTSNFSEELVDVVTLDYYLSLNTPIRQKLIEIKSIMKIDTQGSELSVLRGGGKVLQETPVSAIRLELILDDVYQIPKNNVPEIFSLLYSLDYVLYDVSHIYKDYYRARTLWMDLIFVQEDLI